MRVIFSISLLLCVLNLHPAAAQKRDFERQSTSHGARWLLSPALEPIVFFSGSTVTLDDEKIPLSFNYNYSIGAHLQRFILKRNFVGGVSVQLSRMSYSINEMSIAQLTNNYFDTRFNASFFPHRKENSIAFVKFNAIYLNRFNFKNGLLLNTAQPSQAYKSELISRNQSYLGVGIGVNGYNYRSGSMGLFYSVDMNVYLPLFSGGSFYRRDPSIKDTRTPDLWMAQSPHAGVEVAYKQYFYLKKARKDVMMGRNDSLFSKKPEFLRPFVAVREPRRSLFGGLYLEYGFKGRADSIELQPRENNSISGDVLSYNRIAAGYTLNFFGNHRNNQIYRNSDTGLRYNAYAGLGMQYEAWMIRIHPLQYFRLHQFSTVGRIGYRVGHGKGFYLMGGYRYELPVYGSVLLSPGSFKPKSSSAHSPHGVELYVGFRNAIYIGGALHFTKSVAEEQKNYWRNALFLVRVGH